MAEIIIKAPNTGISSSPHVGVADIRNLDIFTLPGVVRLNNLLAKKSSTTVTNLILWLIKDPLTPANIYALDLGGQVYKSTDSGATWATVAGETAGGAGQGMAIWKDYLFVARASTLDVYGPLSGSPSWSNSWKTIDTDATWHPMIISYNDNKLYGGAGRYVFSLDENTGQTFAPGTGATFTWTQQALDLPPNYRIKSLAEQGNNLMCGTWMGTNIYDYRVADIFPWDRTSPSFTAPVRMDENGVNSMLNINGILYLQAGIEGKIFTCNGVQATQIGQIPSSVADIEGGLYLEAYPGAIMNYKGRPFFGVSSGGSATSIAGMGVWSIQQTSKGNILTHEHTISTGNDGSTTTLKIGALISINRDTLLVGWRDDTTYGIDKTTNTARYTSYTGYFDSAFYNIGLPDNKVSITSGDFLLAKPLATGEGITLKYRTTSNGSWTTIGVFDYATYGAIQGKRFDFKIQPTEFIQVRCMLTTGASSNTSPELRQISLR